MSNCAKLCQKSVSSKIQKIARPVKTGSRKAPTVKQLQAPAGKHTADQFCICARTRLVAVAPSINGSIHFGTVNRNCYHILNEYVVMWPSGVSVDVTRTLYLG